MGRETVTESWFGSLRWGAWKGTLDSVDKPVLGILAFEVAGLMSKVVNLWHSLEEKEVTRLREEILNLVGLQKLVADDGNYLLELALDEILGNFGNLAKSVARLGKKCTNPVYHRFENFINDPILNNVQWVGWEYRWKKMERKVKKMERFVAASMQLTQELEVLTELEQTLRRMQRNAELERVKVLEFQQRVLWQRQEVRNLREMSPWVRTYDYIVRLLIRSLLTILERIKLIFGSNHVVSAAVNNDCELNSDDNLSRSYSFSVVIQSSVYHSENNSCGYSSKPLGRSFSKPLLTTDRNKTDNKHQHAFYQFSALHGKHLHPKNKRSGHVGSFAGCMTGGSDSPILQSCKPVGSGSMRFSRAYAKNIERMEKKHMEPFSCSNIINLKLALFNSKQLLSAPPSTLGDAALALRYANVIILIEKLALSPHLIGLDTRDDLYNMLPSTIRNALRIRLKSYKKTLASHLCNPSLAAEWSLALAQILGWLAPLAHNMIRWQSERNFEEQQVVSRSNVLLVQTLHFANQVKTEAVITELLVGLNYVCRVGRENNGRTFPDPAINRASIEYFINRDIVSQ